MKEAIAHICHPAMIAPADIGVSSQKLVPLQAIWDESPEKFQEIECWKLHFLLNNTDY